MSYWILPSSGIPISCTTVQRLTELEKKTDEWISKMEQYDHEVIYIRWKTAGMQFFLSQQLMISQINIC